MALEVFYSYSHKDEALRDQLQTHLAQLVRNGQIQPWHDRCIAPGDEWRDQIDEHVRSAQIILLLISPDFLASDYCYDVEMKVALERHARQLAIVVPIIVRPVDWAGSPFAHLQALPRDAKAVTLWPDRDQVWAEVAQAIRDLVVRYQAGPARPSPFADLSDQAVAKARVLDAAMPSHIVKDRATELLVLIRLPKSKGLAGILQADEEAEAHPEDVRSKDFDVMFPLGPTGKPEPLKVTIRLTAPDFALKDDRKNLFVPVDRDSEVCGFLLTPLRTGSLMVTIELVWEDADRGYRRLKTNCVAEAETAINPVMQVVRMPLEIVPKRTPAHKRPPAHAIPARQQQKQMAQAQIQSPTSAPVDYTGSYATAPPSLPPAIKAVPKKGFSGSPVVRVAAALCLITLGGTFFVFQRSSSPVPSTQFGPAAPPQAGPTSSDIETAAAQFRQVRSEALGRPVGLSPQVAAEIKAGEESLAAARVDLAAGRAADARKHLALVRTAKKNLSVQLVKEKTAPKYGQPFAKQ